ncbi:tail completion protein gp17 [Sphingomonas sp.]|uniref:tail completion protein gp17 n=1 Tax=Sphingomonas sp. TaxID=28214 RepID=UPI002DD64825|nr:DUF3168 domain-containing protein [Sphingomonas sp.]
MSGAASVLRAAVATALREDAALLARLNGVFEGPAVRASTPYAEVAEALAIDWGTKDRVGREVRIAVLIRHAAETSGELVELAEAAEAAVLAVPRDLPGWALVNMVFVRSRIAGEGPGRWIASVEFRGRMLAAGGA